MTPEKIKLLHRICAVVTAVLIGIVAIGLIVGCLRIYLSGDRPFNEEIVAKTLGYFAIPGILLLISIGFGAVLQILYPVDPGKVKPIREKNARKPNALSPARLKNVRIMIFVIAIGLIILGIIEMGYLDVLNKAIRICQECIGIG